MVALRSKPFLETKFFVEIIVRFSFLTPAKVHPLQHSTKRVLDWLGQKSVLPPMPHIIKFYAHHGNQSGRDVGRSDAHSDLSEIYMHYMPCSIPPGLNRSNAGAWLLKPAV